MRVSETVCAVGLWMADNTPLSIIKAAERLNDFGEDFVDVGLRHWHDAKGFTAAFAVAFTAFTAAAFSVSRLGVAHTPRRPGHRDT